jgi:REP element-mobilizing transposase RayT
MILEPVSPSVYNLTYACLLIPRFPEHLLAGDLAERMREWVPQLCIAFGWRIERLSVHPDYLQWIVNVPPSSSPGYLMRIVRQHTSEKIFEEFPRFHKENPSNDFWAPGYLIMGGTQTPPAQLIREFIDQTRERQGITKPNRS